MSEPAYPTTLVVLAAVEDRSTSRRLEQIHLVQRLLDHPGTLDMKCERLLDARVRTAFILVQPEDIEVEVAIDPSVQALITIECPFSGPVDVDWRYQSTLRNEDEEQVGDWTCPVCGETQEVTR